MSEVASAWVTLIPSAKGFAKRTEAEISGDVTKVGQSSGKRMGGGMSAMLGKTLKVGAVGAAVAAGGLVGTALYKGMGRLVAIDQAKAKLTGLGHSAGSVEKIMGNALASVKGTAFGLDEAGAVAASAVAAGIKPGRDLTKNLKLVADAATIAGTDMGSMGAIFNKVAASNKVQMDVINQLHDAGVPALSLLADQMGVTAEEASKMASDGEIDFETFQKAMQKGLGGAAQESGKTFSGSMNNMKAALGRLGASVLSGIFPKLAPMLSTITGWLDKAGPYAERFGEALGEGISWASDAIGGLFDLFAKGDFSSRFREAFNVQEDSKIVAVLFNIREAVRTAVGWISENLPRVKTAVSDFFTSFASSGQAGQASKIFTDLKATLGEFWTYAKTMFGVAKVVVKGFWDMFGPTILAYIKPTFSNLVSIVRGGLGIVRGIFKTISSLLKGDWKGAWDGIKTILRGAWQVIKAIVSQGWNIVKTLFRAAGIALKASGSAIWTGVKAAFSAGVSAAVAVVRSLKDKAVGALKGAGSWLVSTGQNVVSGLISGIRGMAGAVTSALLNLLPAPLRKFANKLGINSPSTLFRDKFGQYIPLGLAKGIDKGAPAVTASMNSLADGVIRSGAVGLGSPRLGEPIGSSDTATHAPAAGLERTLERAVRRGMHGVAIVQDSRGLRLAIQGA